MVPCPDLATNDRAWHVFGTGFNRGVLSHRTAVLNTTSENFYSRTKTPHQSIHTQKIFFQNSLTLLIRVRVKTHHTEKPKVLFACNRLTAIRSWGQCYEKEFSLLYIIKRLVITSFSFLLTATVNISHSLSNATAHRLRNPTLLLETLAGHQMVGTARFSCIHPVVLRSAALSCPGRGSAHDRGCHHCCDNQILGHSLHHQSIISVKWQVIHIT